MNTEKEGMQIVNPEKTIEIISRINFHFKKKFGQNFLVDSHVLNKIINAAQLSKEDYVLEIGPGIGSLTETLCRKAKKVVAVEIDKDLIEILSKYTEGFDNLEVINADFLKLDVNKLVEEKFNGNKIKVVANLPYYITSAVIMSLLENCKYIESITVMVQKEVAQRILAKPSTKDYGSLTIAVNYYGETYLVANVPQNCFIPRPNVSSAVIRITVGSAPPPEVDDTELFFKITRAAFAQRRKTLVNCLHNVFCGIEKSELAKILVSVGIGENARGEQLTIAEFTLLSNCLGRKLKDKD